MQATKEITAQLLTDIMGKPLDKASNMCEKKGVRLRIIEEEGEKFMHTLELRNDRINAIVHNGVISGASIG